MEKVCSTGKTFPTLQKRSEKHWIFNIKILSCKKTLNSHQVTCIDVLKKKYKRSLREKNKAHRQELLEYKKQLAEKDQQIKELETRLENVAIHAIDRPTSSTTVNFNLAPITDKHFEENVPYLSIEHIHDGAVGYSQYTSKYPLKDKVICTDFARKKVKYKNSEGKLITDPGMTKICQKLFASIKDRQQELAENYMDTLGISGLEGDELIKYQTHINHVKYIANGGKPKLYHEFVNDFCSRTTP